MRNTRVPGHGLLSEGRAYVGEGFCEIDGELRRNPYDQLGVAACSCGWRSGVLDTNGQRKRAYNAHKASARESEGGAIR